MNTNVYGMRYKYMKLSAGALAVGRSFVVINADQREDLKCKKCRTLNTK